MITSAQCLKRFGDPIKESSLAVWVVPREIIVLIPVIPGRIYCNRLMQAALLKAFNNIIDRGLESEMKTWDGCFNIRQKRGATSLSIHAWALAIDINAAWNQFGKPPTMSPELVLCFTDAGFDWGGIWAKPDGMHFQLAAI